MKKHKIIIPLLFSTFSIVAISVPLASCSQEAAVPTDPDNQQQDDPLPDEDRTDHGLLPQVLPTSVNTANLKNIILTMFPDFFKKSGADAKILIERNLNQFLAEIGRNVPTLFANYPSEMYTALTTQRYKFKVKLSTNNVLSLWFDDIPVYDDNGAMLNDGSLVAAYSGFAYYEPELIPPPADGHPKVYLKDSELQQIKDTIQSQLVRISNYTGIPSVVDRLVTELNKLPFTKEKNITFRNAFINEDFSTTNEFKQFQASLLVSLEGNYWLALSPEQTKTGFSVSEGLYLNTPGIQSNISNYDLQNHNTPYPHITEMPRSLDELRGTDPRSIAELRIYDSRRYPIVTQPKDQGKEGLCWSYSTMASSETSILKEGGVVGPEYNDKNLNFDPRNFDFDIADYKPGYDPLNNNPGDYHTQKELGHGYWPELAVLGMQRWMGPSLDYGASHTFWPQLANLEHYDTIMNPTIDQIKYLVAKYGSCVLSFNAIDGMTRKSYIYSPDKPINHAVEIVGWNDSIHTDQFWPTQPSKPGGFIIKNSWGKKAHGGSGCFVLSYESYMPAVSAVDFARQNQYDNNYYYDSFISRSTGGYGSQAANIFEAKKDEGETLKGVNVIVNGNDVILSVKIYKNPTPNQPESGQLVYYDAQRFTVNGSHTIELKTPVPLNKGDTFSIVVQPVGGQIAVSDGEKSTNDLSYGLINGKWENIRKTKSRVARIKAFTKTNPKTYSLEKASNLMQNADIDLKIINNKLIPKVTIGDQELVRDTDYELQYNYDTKMMRVVGINDYHGAKSVEFNPTPEIKKTYIPSWTLNESMNSIKLAGQYLAKFRKVN